MQAQEHVNSGDSVMYPTNAGAATWFQVMVKLLKNDINKLF